MKPGSKVVASHDVGSMRGKALSNPNLDPDLINKRFEESDKDAEEEKISSVPKELKGLENLIFLGANTKDVSIGDFVFTISTLTSKEQDVVFKNAIKLNEQERIFFFKKGITAISIKKINGKLLSSYFEEDSFESRLDLISSMQQSVLDIIFSEIEQLTNESSKLLTAENLKK